MPQPSLKYWREKLDRGCKTFDHTVLSHIDCTELSILLEELYNKREKLNNPPTK